MFLHASRWRIAVLSISSALEGFSEAAFLVVLVRLALALSSGKHTVALSLGPLSSHGHMSVASAFSIGLALALLGFALQVVNAYFPARMSSDALASLRKGIFALYLHSTWDLQSREKEGQLQELMTGQITRAAQAVLIVASGLSAGCNFLALMISALVVSPAAAGGIVLAVIVLFFALRPLAKRARALGRQRSAASVDYSVALSEVVRMTEEIRVLGAQDQVQQRVALNVERVADPYFKSQFLSNLIAGIYQGVATLLVLGGLGIVYLLGGGNLASLGAVVLILTRALSYSQTLQTVYHRLNDLAGDMDRVVGARDRYARAPLESGDVPLERVDSVAFRDVSFAYRKGVYVLRDVSFDIQHGETIGIVGPSGAGKSTLVQLLLRLRDPTDGSFVVSGHTAADISLAEWTQRVGYVPQDPRLLTATVAENIRFYRKHLSDADVVDAAKQAHVHDEIMALPDGYETTIGQRADAVSGGQRQRLCIARALAGRPDLLILDEPTSALDVRSESLVQESLKALHGELTLLIVAHRLSTLNICDRIMVIVNGVVEAFESPRTVLQTNAFYRQAVELSHLKVTD